ncbi:branched-chain amino acid transport system permease protein [Halogranum gelatinilyticum]|uniref:Branched-chain amino acid transport system permease protein n=1 Tax=Halogranum gelatinilyticum TaxID=660521 RepID=A0A1G9XEH5_9EURY|nr:urea ABC transporter permease [Halogranum gelatinilyticum]SDM94846.1 branched-chain amino acid transport system permease protein [Halogranum gelatinilyticum]
MATPTENASGSLPTSLASLRALVEGPNTIGASRRFWVGFAVVLVALLAYPVIAGSYAASRLSLFVVYAFLGLSLAIVWGYTGVLSFGQVAFFGAAGYTFGVISVNFSTPLGITAAFLLAIVAGAGLAFVLGYFMFYGGVRDVYVTIITLVSTLVLHTFMAQTAGSQWTIGEAALGGFNGMPTIPDLAFGVGGFALTFSDMTFYYFVVALLCATYLGLRAVVNSDYGRVMVATREDEDRTRMFGYDVKRVKLAVFTFGGALAGLSGVLYASWGNYINPDVFSLTFASLPVVWVSVGGRKTLLGAVLATIGVQWFSNILSGQLAFIIVGVLLLTVILVLPEGAVPRLHDYYVRYVADRQEGDGVDDATRPTEVAE